MARSKWCHFLIVAVLGVAAMASSFGSELPGTGRGSRTTEFRNGNRLNLDNLMNALNNGLTDGTIGTSLNRQRFNSADQAVRGNRNEQNFRNIFNRRPGNEFIDSDNVSATAQTDVQMFSTLVDQSGIDTAQSSDADGNPIDSGVDAVSEERVANCPYDRANSAPCMNTFREPTGRCTNVVNGRKTWGMAGTPYTRLLAAVYENGIDERRKTGFVSKRPLKSPREISTLVTTNRVILNFDGHNSQIMQWGQFIAHEFTHLSESEADAACCPDEIFASRHGTSASPTSAQLEQIRQEVERFRGDVCMQIERDNDPEYGSYVCMSQTRSRPAPLHDCSLGPRQQMNAITHLFDASAVYGSSLAEMNALRDTSGGKLKTQVVNGVTLPPPDLANCPAAKRTVNKCPFLGGDTRINTTPNLISTHTTAIIKHNQIAERLSSINSHWDNERLFQETRKIIAGIESNIHYYEYLPTILGSTMINKFGLNRYAGFDAEVNPSSLNELAHAAMRFGHSTVDGFFTTIKDNGDRGFENLRPRFGDSDFIYDGGIKQCIKGLMADVPWIVDRNYPEQMRDFLFDSRRDIISLNINRGRDHGFPSYIKYREFYGLSVPRSFDDLSTTHDAVVVTGLRRSYERIEDVELYIAGVTEKPVSGGLVGELFANIIADGFSRILKGDKYFFESPHSGLTPAQISAIRGYKYNQFLCEGAGLVNISDNAFVKIGSLGAREVSCSSFTPLNLNLWREPEPVGPVEPTCAWRVTSNSGCCYGQRQITRSCVGTPGCQCRGNRKIRQQCTCRGRRCHRNVRRRCAWRWRYSFSG